MNHKIRHVLQFVLQNYTIPISTRSPTHKGLPPFRPLVSNSFLFVDNSAFLDGLSCEPCTKSLMPTPVFVCGLKLMFYGVYLTHRYSQ